MTGLVSTEINKTKNEKLNIVLLEDDRRINNLHKSLDSGRLQLNSIIKTDDVHLLFDVIQEKKTDIVVLHIVLPEIDWVDLVMKLKKNNSNIKIIAYSSYIKRKFILKVMGAGAAGYVMEKRNHKDLLLSMDIVRKDGVFLSSEILAGPSEFQEIPASVNKDISFLSDREKDVIRMIGEGFSTKEIGFDLRISSKTVATYRDRIMKKLDIYNIAGLTKFAITVGLTNLE